MSVHSYLPQERKDAAEQLLGEAVKNVVRTAAAWESRTSDDDATALLDHVHGAQAEVANWQRYIKAGCPRVRGTA